MTTSAVLRIEFAMLEKFVPCYEREMLGSPASELAIADAEQRARIQSFTTQLASLYRWHNGSSCDLFPNVPLFGFRFMDLSRALETYDLLRGLGVRFRSERSFFPIGDDGQALYLATLSGIDPNVSQIYQYVIDDGEVRLFYQDIGALVRTFCQVWSEQAGVGETLEDVRLQFSPVAAPEDQDGFASRSGVKNVFLSEEFPPEGLVT